MTRPPCAAAGSTLTYKDRPLYTVASVFMLGFPYGLPRVMSSYAFHDVNAGPPLDQPVCSGECCCRVSQNEHWCFMTLWSGCDCMCGRSAHKHQLARVHMGMVM